MRSGAIPAPVLPAGTFQGRQIRFTSWEGYGGNLPELQANAASAGHFNPLVDPDGVSRRVPMLVEYNDAYYEALSLAMIRVLAGNPKVEPGFASEQFSSKSYSGLESAEGGSGHHSGGRHRERADSLPRQARQLQIYLACRRLFRPECRKTSFAARSR